MKRANIDRVNLLNDLRNFNDDIFRKDMTYDNIKIKKKTKKTGPHSLSLKNTFLEKPWGECRTEPPRPFKESNTNLNLIRLVRSFTNC